MLRALYALYALRAVCVLYCAAQLVSANCAARCMRFVLRCARCTRYALHVALRAHYKSWAERRDICVISQFVV